MACVYAENEFLFQIVIEEECDLYTVPTVAAELKYGEGRTSLRAIKWNFLETAQTGNVNSN